MTAVYVLLILGGAFVVTSLVGHFIEVQEQRAVEQWRNASRQFKRNG